MKNLKCNFRIASSTVCGTIANFNKSTHRQQTLHNINLYYKVERAAVPEYYYCEKRGLHTKSNTLSHPCKNV